MKKVIHIRRSIGFKRISSSRFMQKRSFTSVNLNADKIRKIQFEPNTPLQISTKQLKKRKPSSMRTVKYCAAVYKARKQTIFRTFLANGGKLEDFPISDTESESDSDTVEMKSIQVVKVVHPELRKVTQDCEDGTKRVDRYLTLFKTCTEQKDKGSTTSKDVVYKIYLNRLFSLRKCLQSNTIEFFGCLHAWYICSLGKALFLSQVILCFFLCVLTI